MRGQYGTLATMADPDDDQELIYALRQRLHSIDIELTEITQRREKLGNLRRTVEATLVQEEALQKNSAIPAIHPTGGQSLSDLILRLLAVQPMALEQLKEAGGGWPLLKGKDFPGRAINFALVGLQKGGHVERLENGVWKLIPGSNRK